jgi:phosphate uptake regulator
VTVLKALLAIFTSDHPLTSATKDFSEMMNLTQEMLEEASDVFWGKAWSPEERTALYEKDVRVNKLERLVRKRIITHLSGPEPASVPYALLVMSLVKDVERLGDYAKNLAEVSDIYRGERPDDDCVGELREISKSVMMLAREAADVFVRGDTERATELTIEGRNVAKRCDMLILAIAGAGYEGRIAVALTLGARFYKRIEAHLLNLLSGVIMPLHKLHYFDEKVISAAEE